MTTTPAAADVFKLLNELRKTNVADGSVLGSAEPDPTLIHNWEQDFVDGYEIDVGGHCITLEQVWDAYVAGENLLFVGPSGCGKSTIAYHLLDKANEVIRAKNRKVYQENIEAVQTGKNPTPYIELPYQVSPQHCNEATRSAELIGDVTIKVNPDGSRTPVVVRGSVTDAWINGKTLIIEELDIAPPGVLAELHAFFDGRTQETVIYTNGPERIRKNSRFRVIATANTKGAGENQIEFAGTRVMNKAFMNRFTYVLEVTWLPQPAEKDLILRRTGLRPDVAFHMVESACKTRDAHKAGTVDVCISTRDILSWARECKRAEKRWELKKGDPSVISRINDYWTEIARPAAYPAFLARIADTTTQGTFQDYLSLR